MRIAENGAKLLTPSRSDIKEGNVVLTRDDLGTFSLIGRELYLVRGNYKILAISFLANSNYDELVIAKDIGFTTSYHPIYINQSTTMTNRIEFHPENIDVFGACLAFGGIAVDLITMGVGGRLVNYIEIANTTGKMIDVVDPVYGIIQLVSDPSISSGLGVATDYAGIYFPVVPDIFGLLLNLGGAIEIYQ